MDIQEEVKHGIKIASRADLIWGWSTPAGKSRALRRENFIIEIAGLEENQRVLELGCGTGFHTAEISKSKAKIIGVDISPDLINVARQRANFPNVKFIVADAHNLPFPNKFFDSIVGVSVLHHLEMDKVFKEIRRLLKTKGKIVFSEPNMMNPQIFLMKNIPWFKKLLNEIPNETAFFRSYLSIFLKKQGFKNIKVIPFDFLHPLMPAFLVFFMNRISLSMEKIPLLKEIAGSLLISAER